ncbi:MerR family transcriptional regulator [Oceanispirochaeta crateris]|uniref:MerR family transcriptional regulator n=1 Tax=Oceanispirochaeta crateris TaxID=2518645 RepID=A0A5C1QHQ7_9SPIO|nr:MerR family transcriptional regulator [Oceanispirochaeta crateris]QEN07675.1 MerR family transcriptional regulator [Oceanispirochaeta crateris]
MTTTKTNSRVYSLKEMKELSGLSEDTLRYYEKIGILPGISRLPNGHRQYSQHDLDWLQFVLCLRSTGMPLKEIKTYRELQERGDSTVLQRKVLLLSQKEKILGELDTLHLALKRINHKIEYYDSL